MTSTLHKQISYSIPKAELHCHIEGTIQPDLIIKLAKKNKIEELMNITEDDIKSSLSFSNLHDFLKVYVAYSKVLIDEDDYSDLMYEYLKKSSSQGMKYSEVFLDLQSNIKNSYEVDIPIRIKGIYKGKLKAEKEFGVKSSIILCFLRDKSVEEANLIFEISLKFRSMFVGIGLASNEYGHPPDAFEDLFRRGEEEGLKLVCHAGEDSIIPIDYIVSAIDRLKVNRIDHGIQSYKSEEVMRKIVNEKVHLTVCPVSNIRLKAFSQLNQLPIRTFLEKGVSFSLNSDDPSYFNCFIGDVYYSTGLVFDFSIDEYKLIARNSFLSSFLDEKSKSEYLDMVDEYVNGFGSSDE